MRQVSIDFSNNQMQALPARINLFSAVTSLNMNNNRLVKVLPGHQPPGYVLDIF